MKDLSYLSSFVESYLPYDAVILTFRKQEEKPAIIVKDIDSDGILEVAAVYRWQDEDYIIVLKNYFSGWHVMVNSRTIGQSVSYLLEKLRVPLVNLYPAPIRTAEGKRWGFINDKGEFIIKPQYDYAYDFQSNGLASVSINNLFGLIDTIGKFVVKPQYQSIIHFSEGRAAVITNKGFNIIDEKGNELAKKSYSFIGNFNNGRALVSDTNSEGKYLYGYLDLQGNEIIPLKYENASDFKKDKAVVKLKDNEFLLIDIDGRVLNKYNYYFVGAPGEGLLVFQKEENGPYGYIAEKGNIVIEPKYTGAEPFQNDRAIVNIAEDYKSKYGLIDKKGSFIINPEYGSMNFLGENRLSAGKEIDPEKPFIGYNYAVANTNGLLLTDFIYSNISNYKGNLASASDNKNTFFIDKSGKLVRTLPVVSGGGSLIVMGEVIRADVDMRITYFDKAGNVIYKESTEIPLDGKYKVVERKYRPNKDYLVYYPQIDGMKNKSSQQVVNKKLKEMSGANKNVNPDVQLESSFTGDFSIEFFKKNLLVLELNSYDFTFGAAHGMPSKVYPHIDLISGRFYELKNLFKQNSNYVKVLSDIIGEQIKNDPQYEYVFPDTYKGIKADQPFYVDKDNLYIYFTPYEIAPYAAGFPTFKIPFKDIMNTINTQGDFWKSFN
jgi:hypothetical protein